MKSWNKTSDHVFWRRSRSEVRNCVIESMPRSLVLAHTFCYTHLTHAIKLKHPKW
jgi:hypothetical protein